jgi:hypothetical protein
MEQTNTETAPTSPPVKLAEVAIELGEPVEAIEREIGAHNVFTHGGFRCCTGFQAAQLLERRAKQKAEAEEEARAAGEAARSQHEAARARAVAQRADTRPRVKQFGLSMVTVSPLGPEDVPAVVAMTQRAGGAAYEGSVMTPRPSRLDWLSGNAEGGASIGPSRAQVAKAARQRRDERKAAKKGGAS